MTRPDRMRILQWLTVLVPAVCAGLYETVRHSLLATELPNALGTLIAVALVLVISFGFARLSFGMIRRTQARLRERNRALQALSREVERLAVLEERDRLAREMHDSAAQVLAYLLVRLDTIESLLDRQRTPEAVTEVRCLRASAQDAYADVREAIAGLRARPGAGAAGLAASLDEYAAQFADRTGIAASFFSVPPELEGKERAEAALTASATRVSTGAAAALTPAAELQLVRIAQEALANVRKHAGAGSVAVHFWPDARGWHLLVRDDGAGFDPAAPVTPGRQHFGLLMMRERAESLGGELLVASAPGAGTTVHARVPAAAGGGSEPAASRADGQSEPDERDARRPAPVAG